jgi:uncharacterized membrane-anchored protein YitT (DUF2179 family)
MASVYNLFFVPYHIVTGGTSGVAILVNAVFKISTTTFINVSNVVLAILGLIMLGKKKTAYQLVGCIFYLTMVNVTSSLSDKLVLNFNSDILMLLIIAIIYGIGTGLVYRSGYSTGGADFLSEIISERTKKPMTQINLIMQIIIISSSAFIFGIVKVMYSILVIVLSNRITNAILFGISTDKIVYIISSKNDEIEKYIINKINSGVTEIKVHGGLFEKKRHMIMCVVHNSQYSIFKNTVLSIDDNAFILSNACYEVSGGKKYNVLPF